MKQKDIAALLVIVVVSGILSFFVARTVFVSSKDKSVTAEVVAPISTTFEQPSTKYFNENSINPTPEIQIGNSANPTPYNGQ